ncbi:MAG: HigA family addiction module antidote protein [Chloroflexi bacterium]|nr:HigA family addiction module antidote protein [Chloroflexota bacterium]
MVTKTKRAVYSDMAIPPGEILAEELQALGMTQKECARRMSRPAQVINEIINAKKAITAETALQLELVVGGSADYWLGLEATYRLTLARNAMKASGSTAGGGTPS